MIGALGWIHVTAIIDSSWSQATIRKLHDVSGLRHICIVDVIVVHNEVSSIQSVLRRTVEEHARKGGLFCFLFQIRSVPYSSARYLVEAHFPILI